MSSLSIVMIVKNEAESIEKSIKSVNSIADEIVILDSGSTDNTVEICQMLGARVHVNQQWPGYGKQRQIAQGYASSEWVFMLDADEEFTDELREEVRQIVLENEQANAWQVPRLSYVFGRFIRHCGWYPDYVIRLYPKNKATYNDNLVHEKLNVPETMVIKNLNNDLLHFTYKDVEDYLVKSARYAKASAKQKFQAGKRSSIFNAGLHGLACFIKMYLIRVGFLDGKQGLILSVLSAHSTFVKYLSLWEMSSQNNDK